MLLLRRDHANTSTSCILYLTSIYYALPNHGIIVRQDPNQSCPFRPRASSKPLSPGASPAALAASPDDLAKERSVLLSTPATPVHP